PVFGILTNQTLSEVIGAVRYRWAIAVVAGVVLTQFGLIAGLLLQRRQRPRSERALRHSEERYREVVDSQMDLVIRYLPDTTLTFVNEAYCRFFNRPRSQLLGTKFLTLIPESARAAASQHLAALVEQGGTSSIEHEVILPDGTVGWQFWTDHVISAEDGRVLEIQG